MSDDPLKQFKRLVINNRLAANYAADFERQRKKLDALAHAVFLAKVRGTTLPSGVFEALADAAQDLNTALAGLRGQEPLERIRLPAAALTGSMGRLLKAL